MYRRLCRNDKVTDKSSQRYYNPTVGKTSQLSSDIISYRHKAYVCTAKEQYQPDKRIDKTDTDTVNIFFLQF